MGEEVAFVAKVLSDFHSRLLAFPRKGENPWSLIRDFMDVA